MISREKAVEAERDKFREQVRKEEAEHLSRILHWRKTKKKMLKRAEARRLAQSLKFLGMRHLRDVITKPEKRGGSDGKTEA
jgi:hypothetical protein